MAKCFALVLLCLAMAAPSHAAFPDEPITIVVPFAPGGMNDVVASTLRDPLRTKLGKSVMIEHIAGASGTIGALRVKNAPPSGHIIMLASLGVYVTNTLVRKPEPYDPLRDFDLLTVAVRSPLVLSVHPSVPADNVAQFVAYLKSGNGNTLFATPGESSEAQLIAQQFWRKTGTHGDLIALKGGGPALNEVVSGKALVLLQTVGTTLPAIRSGKLKALAIASGARWPGLPDVPTMAEAGVPNFEHYSWQAFAAPKGLSPQVKRRLQAALVETLHTPAIKRSFTEDGFEVVGSSPEEFEHLIRTETAHWRAMLRETQQGRQ